MSERDLSEEELFDLTGLVSVWHERDEGRQLVERAVAELRRRRAADLTERESDLLRWMHNHADANSVERAMVDEAKVLVERLIVGAEPAPDGP